MTQLEERFCEEYLVDLNAKAAYERAHGCSEVRGAKQSAYNLLQREDIQDRITDLKAARSQRVSITADDVLRHFWNLATADANELVEYRRACCRHCHGEGHEYQLTRAEMSKRRREWEARKRAADVFDPMGGEGFDPKREPHPECPECFGDGTGEMFVKDTRRLTAAARRLYAGVKVTKDGLEVRMHDPVSALVKLGEHLGMFGNKRETDTATPEERARAIRAELEAMDTVTLGPT